MSNNLVLVTGATGFVGFRILELLIQAGYPVRLAVRSESKLEDIYAAFERTNTTRPSLETVIVPDMLLPGAFDKAVHGVKYIVHVASPLPSGPGDYEQTLIRPAVDAALSILHSAHRELSVKKVVITSSVAAVSPDTPKIFTADDVVPNPQAPFANPFVAYTASKKMALNATRQFIEKEKPGFDVVNIMPSFIVGRNNLAKTRKDYVAGSNGMALQPLIGVKGSLPGFVCHVDDVATIHVKALGDDVKGHRNFGVNSRVEAIEWNDAKRIVKEHVPEVTQLFSFDGDVESTPTGFDASPTEKEFDLKFKQFDQMIVDLVKGYAEVEA